MLQGTPFTDPCALFFVFFLCFLDLGIDIHDGSAFVGNHSGLSRHTLLIGCSHLVRRAFRGDDGRASFG